MNGGEEKERKGGEKRRQRHVEASVRHLKLVGDAFLWIRDTLSDNKRKKKGKTLSEKGAALLLLVITTPIWIFLLLLHACLEIAWRPSSSSWKEEGTIGDDGKPDSGGEKKRKIRIMTYNVQSCTGGRDGRGDGRRDGRGDVGRVGREIVSKEADVVLLQEVLSSQVDQLSDACSLPYSSFFPLLPTSPSAPSWSASSSASSSRQGGEREEDEREEDEWGIAVLSRLPFDKDESGSSLVLPLPLRSWEGRQKRASLFCRMGGVWYGSAHLQNDFLCLESKEQVHELVSSSPRPFLVGVDSNLPRSSFVPLVSSLGAYDLCERVGNTFPSYLPLLRFDTVLSSFPVKVVDSATGLTTNDPCHGSDHLPVTVSLLISPLTEEGEERVGSE